MTEYTQEDCIRDTKEHIAQVREFMIKFAHELLDRAMEHDKSKLESPELEIFTEYTPKLKASTYGSPEYQENLKGMVKALQHHYMKNRHHPEHFQHGILQMNLVDIVEMLCDWKAATMRHADGDIVQSITINQKRFGYSDDLAMILGNTVPLLYTEEDKQLLARHVDIPKTKKPQAAVKHAHADYPRQTMSLRGGVQSYYLGDQKRYMDNMPPYGRKVRFLNENGYDMERKEAAKVLDTDTEYTVHEIYVDRSSSKVELVEFPGKLFNTVMFADVEET